MSTLDVTGLLDDDRRSSRSSGSSRRQHTRSDRLTKGRDPGLRLEDGTDIETIADAFETETALWVLTFMVWAGYASILTIGISMPVLSFTPDGPFNQDGWFYFISDGFEKHSVLSSLIYGVGTLYIGFARALAIIIYVPGKLRVIVYSCLLIVTQAGGMLTTRNDEFQDFHLYAAATWIASSIMYHAAVVAWNQTFDRINGGSYLVKGAWCLSTAAALVFLIMVMTGSWLKSRDMRLGTGIAEFICAEMILVLDALIVWSIHRRFLMHRGPVKGQAV